MVEMLQLITYNWERKAILCLLIFKDCNEAVNGMTPTLILSFCPSLIWRSILTEGLQDSYN